MSAILGIDAAWTIANPSGIALVRLDGGKWRCLGVFPSAHALIERAFGRREWPRVYLMRSLVEEALAAADVLAGEPVRVVALDLPLSKQPIAGRRPADNLTSAYCGSFGCPTHSPTVSRPGPLGEAYQEALVHHGFVLDTNENGAQRQKCAIEVYPHPAIMALVKSTWRLPYKVGKTLRYWPETKKAVRWRLVLGVLQRILSQLQEEIDGIGLELPSQDEPGTMSSLKSKEDMIDALVCAWVGIQHLAGRTRAFGDADAAIWLLELDHILNLQAEQQ